MVQDVLLFLMIVSYCFSIYIVYNRFVNDYSISSIICHDNCNSKIKVSMMCMFLFTFLYELLRNDNITLILIIMLIVGINGVLNTKENQIKHYIYALLTFSCIISFMYYNSNKYKSLFLEISFNLQIGLFILNILLIKINIFIIEVASLLNFAIFYLYLHKYI